MRAVIAVIAALTAASPVAAQVPLAIQRDNELWAQQQAARQREVATYNEFIALDARVRADQALRDLERQTRDSRLPPADPAQLRTSQPAAIPDDRLEASNARVREASRNRR